MKIQLVSTISTLTLKELFFYLLIGIATVHLDYSVQKSANLDFNAALKILCNSQIMLNP